MKPIFYSGFHAIEALLNYRPQDVLELFILDGRSDKRLDDLLEQARHMGIACHRAGKATLEKHAGPQNQGVVARARPREPGNENALQDFLVHNAAPKLLLLDEITDPHNLGACLRVADGAGIDAVIVPRRHSAGLTPTACRSAAGAAESLTYFEVGNLARIQALLKEKGIFIYGTALSEDSTALYGVVPPTAWALVMGAEDTGMRRLVQDNCDQIIAIPMRGSVQSLNVSVATAVALYWLTKAD
jgi:23S rRNA (guanosine2251-2'-O)-methyltransferase